jgi:ribosomal-protein-alanine N-acetyltransferase
MYNRDPSMTASNPPPIITQTVTLRHLVPDDAAKIFAMSQESGLRTWLPDQVYQSEEEALAVLQYLDEKYRDPGTPSLAPYVLGVCLIGSNELIGHVGLSPLDEQVEIGYAIEDKYQGQGIASQAVRAMSEWALVHFTLPRILGIVAANNSASCKVLQNADFELIEESMGILHDRSCLVRKYERV